MRAKLRQVGNSVGLTIPAGELRALDAEVGDEVELEITKVLRLPRATWDSPRSWPGVETAGDLLPGSSTAFDDEEWEW